jgi:hypothetical protein
MGHKQNDVSNTSSTVTCVFIAAVTFLQIRLLATIRRIYIQTYRLVGGIIKYAFDMGSGAKIHIPSFIKIESGVHKLMGAERAHREHGDLMSMLLVFLNN